ncbi:MAG: hypothetical protein ACRCSA_00400, partial [Morganella morganii]
MIVCGSCHFLYSCGFPLFASRKTHLPALSFYRYVNPQITKNRQTHHLQLQPAITGRRAFMERLTGAEMIVRSLIDEGVSHVFGYPGG